MSDSWFATRPLGAGVHLVSEPVHVNCFLVEGADRAVLVDTGLGIANIGEVVGQLTRLPIAVVNTHYHYDHTGGNHAFEDIAIHGYGDPSLTEPVPDSLYSSYIEYTTRMTAAFSQFRRLDKLFFHLLTDETTARSFPDGFDSGKWHSEPWSPTRLLEDGDEIDLGGRTLKVLHTPGHTPDSICLLDEKEGILFGGDTINTGPLCAQFTDSDPVAFAESTRQLAELAREVRVVYVAHFLRHAADPGFLVEVADGFEALVGGAAQLESTVDVFGRPVREARFPSFSIYVADPDRPLTPRSQGRPGLGGASGDEPGSYPRDIIGGKTHAT